MNDPELEQLVGEFLKIFEAVFGSDWKHTLMMMYPFDNSSYIQEGATFIEPNVEDEYDDWGNRGMLLEKYRALKSLLAQRRNEIS